MREESVPAVSANEHKGQISSKTPKMRVTDVFLEIKITSKYKIYNYLGKL